MCARAPLHSPPNPLSPSLRSRTPSPQPVGALNPSRLEAFKDRRRSMSDSPGAAEGTFLYGTLYSAPGHVLFYLLRSLPVEALCLQGGQFDHPDRTFFDWSKCWESVMQNSGDVKELPPDVFEGKGFSNDRGLELGARQTGKRVDDVELPWGMGPREFGEWLREQVSTHAEFPPRGSKYSPLPSPMPSFPRPSDSSSHDPRSSSRTRSNPTFTRG